MQKKIRFFGTVVWTRHTRRGAARGHGTIPYKPSTKTTYQHYRQGRSLIFHVFASLAECKRDLICKRTQAGLQVARARERNGGRSKGVDEKKRKAVLALKRDPQYSVKEICEIVGISRNTYYKYTRADA
jgi:DNA invertase Pin-like site-specific DNA recombinase